jgi:hypothetical protein
VAIFELNVTAEQAGPPMSPEALRVTVAVKAAEEQLAAAVLVAGT